MLCYEIIDPSDTATFLAPDREIALAALAFIGEGQYGGSLRARYDGGKLVPVRDEAEAEPHDVPIFLFGGYDKWWAANGWSEEPIDKVVRERREALVEALRSVSYSDLEDRRTYDSALAAITDAAKRAEFVAGWEDRRRSSMNRIAQRAWKIADHLAAKEVAA